MFLSSKFICRFTLVLFVLSGAGAQETGAVLSLKQMIEQAEMVNTDYLATKQSIEALLNNEEIARSNLLPKVALSHVVVDVGRQKQWQMNLQLNQDILNLPNYRYWQAAEQVEEGARLQLQQQKSILWQHVVLLWIDYQAKEEALRLLQNREKTIANQLETAQILQQANRVTATDVLAAQASLANIQAQIQQAKHDIEIAQSLLQKEVAGVAHRQSLALTEKQLPPLDSLGTWWALVEKNNLALKMAAQNLLVEEKNYEAAQAAVFPRISYTLSSRATQSLGNREESLNLSLVQNLWTSGALTAEKEKRLTQLASKRTTKIALAKNLKQQLQEILGQMDSYIIQSHALSKAEESARSLLNATSIGYKNGVNTHSDVLNAEDNLSDIQSQLRTVIFNYIKSYVALHHLNNSLNHNIINQIEGFFNHD